MTWVVVNRVTFKVVSVEAKGPSEARVKAWCEPGMGKISELDATPLQ